MAWSVNFKKDGPPGRDVSVDKRFFWNGCSFWIPAVYICDEGIVLDICVEADREAVAVFLEKWRYLFEKERQGKAPNRREYQQFRQENPLDEDFWPALSWNGISLQYEGGSGSRWIPPELYPIFANDVDAPGFMEQYHLSPDRVWQFRRDRFCWAEADSRELQTLTLTLSQRPKTYYGLEFTPKETGEQIRIPNPLDGSECVLTVLGLNREKVPASHGEGLLFPEHCVSIWYSLEPELPREVFSLADVQDSDQPKRIGDSKIIGGAYGVIVRDQEHPEAHLDVSSVHFEPVESVTWQAQFRAKMVEDLTVQFDL